jgi:peptidyl-prolyl cis-trans isomerase D
MNKENSSKKESTSVLEKIRRRTGLLVGIVGLALVIFILESLLGSGASIFGGDELTTVGTVNGKKIDRNDFMMQLENRLNQYRQRNQGGDVDDQVRAQAVDGIIQQYVLEHAIMPQFHKAGITVSEDELYEKVVIDPDPTVIQNLTDPNTGKVNEQFARPDGSLDPMKWRQAVQNVTGESEMAVRQMEEMVQTSLYYQKFRALVNKGLYVTKAEAEKLAVERRNTHDISFVQKPYAAISDSAVKVDEDDMEKYYKEHKYLYKNPENSRKLEYVAFDVLPSAEDLAEIEKSAIAAAEQLKGKSPAEDSVIMAQESENGNIMVQEFTKKTMIVRDSGIYTAAPGTVFGPYNEGAYFKIYKLQGVSNIADSARVRHILVGLQDAQTQQPKRSKPQAKREADSILVLLKEKKTSFDSLVISYSDDMGSKMNGGDYGWFDENKGFVEPFKNAGLKGTKGNISVVETEFGYHIIEVLDVSNSRHTSYRVAQVFKPIQASDETNQAVFAKANQFGGENSSADKFDKAVEEQKLTRRRADNVREGDFQLPGLDGAKEIVRWAFTANKGDVSVFTVPGKHVVAKLSGIKEKGILPLEEVEEEVMAAARKQKKKEMLLEEFKAGGESLDALATKLGVQVTRQDNFDVEPGNINGVGNDQIMAGTISGTAKGKTSRAVAGQNGVFKVMVSDIRDKGGITSEAMRTEAYQLITGRTDYEVYNAIKEQSDIDIHKSRID